MRRSLYDEVYCSDDTPTGAARTPGMPRAASCSAAMVWCMAHRPILQPSGELPRPSNDQIRLPNGFALLDYQGRVASARTIHDRQLRRPRLSLAITLSILVAAPGQ